MLHVWTCSRRLNVLIVPAINIFHTHLYILSHVLRAPVRYVCALNFSSANRADQSRLGRYQRCVSLWLTMVRSSIFHHLLMTSQPVFLERHFLCFCMWTLCIVLWGLSFSLIVALLSVKVQQHERIHRVDKPPSTDAHPSLSMAFMVRCLIQTIRFIFVATYVVKTRIICRERVFLQSVVW